MAVPEHHVHYLEIVTPNLEGARDLYQTAFGWDFEGPIPELGNAWIASMPGGGTCGIRAPMHEQERETVRNYFRGRISIVMVGNIEQGFWQVDS